MIALTEPCHSTAAGASSSALRWAELAEILGRCERRLRDELAQHAAPLGLTPSQFSLLWTCRQAPPEGLSQNELATALALSPAHVSAQVEHLRARDMLIGQRKAPDRRKQVWQLTPEGHDRLTAMLTAMVAWAARLEEKMSPSQRQSLTSLLAELAGVLDAAAHTTDRSSCPLEPIAQ